MSYIDKVPQFILGFYMKHMSMEKIISLCPDEFVPYKGDYLKVLYDVITKDGTTYLYCYPNGGDFSPYRGPVNKVYIKGEDVVSFKVSELQINDFSKMDEDE